jgi:hypothetical protein
MLLDLIGTHALTEVASVHCNRIEFTFNDTTLTILGQVTVTTPQGPVTEAGPGHKAALRALIGHHVTSVEYSAHSVRLRFTSGVSIDTFRRRRFKNGREVICLGGAGLPEIAQHVA